MECGFKRLLDLEVVLEFLMDFLIFASIRRECEINSKLLNTQLKYSLFANQLVHNK